MRNVLVYDTIDRNRRTERGLSLLKMPDYFIVEASVLPEVYLKVAEAKQYLETGEERTVNSAARRAGISRSAFYKYKEAIRPFRDMMHGRIVTIQILLRDEPGALSSVLNLFAQRGGNVLTINQAIPGGGTAAVTVGLETSGLGTDLENLLDTLRAEPTVVRCEVLAG